jgi:threonine aldolase
MRSIDLRSDTVTRPTVAMREAMASAEVGDDVFGEDPTVNRLEAAAAERVGKEAALFVPSGTMANQIAIGIHTRHGESVLASQGAHILRYEAGGAAALAGVQITTIGARGLFDAEDVRAAVLPASNVHFAPTSLLAIENTHNASGGRIFPIAQLEAATAAARDEGLRTHLDGARLWNAVVASGIAAPRWAASFDTLSFCFSKGLGAPVGSVLCGSRDAVMRARRLRKMFGGGMRQAGILAAAALQAIEHHVARLVDDHANARRLAEGLQNLGLPVDPLPETNIVIFDVADTIGFARAAHACGVLVIPLDPGRFRAVTHLDVSADDIDEALTRIASLLDAQPELRPAA